MTLICNTAVPRSLGNCRVFVSESRIVGSISLVVIIEHLINVICTITVNVATTHLTYSVCGEVNEFHTRTQPRLRNCLRKG